MSITKTKIQRIEKVLKGSSLIENGLLSSHAVVFQERDGTIKYAEEIYKNLEEFEAKNKRIERCIILPSRTPTN